MAVVWGCAMLDIQVLREYLQSLNYLRRDNYQELAHRISMLEKDAVWKR